MEGMKHGHSNFIRNDSIYEGDDTIIKLMIIEVTFGQKVYKTS